MKNFIFLVFSIISVSCFAQPETTRCRWYENGEYGFYPVGPEGYNEAFLMRDIGDSVYHLHVLYAHEDFGMGVIYNVPYGVQPYGNDYWLESEDVTNPVLTDRLLGYQHDLMQEPGSTGDWLHRDGAGVEWLSLSDVAESGDYDDLAGKPSLATVATSGSYNDLSNKPSIPSAVANYGPSGSISVTKEWSSVVTPSTSNGYSIDISSAGFSNIHSVIVVAAKNTSSAGTSPQVSLKSYTTSAVVVNVTEASSSTQNVLINLLGGATSVLSGSPLVFANTSGLTLHVTVKGN